MNNSKQVKVIGCIGVLLMALGIIYPGYLELFAVNLGVLSLTISLEMHINSEKAVRKRQDRLIDVAFVATIIMVRVLSAPVILSYVIMGLLVIKLIWKTIIKGGDSTNEEIERKFLVNLNKLFDTVDLTICKKYIIEQAYLAVGDNEIRVRQITNSFKLSNCVITAKSKENLLRKEIEWKLPKKEYKSLIEAGMYKGDIINKERYRIPLSGDLIAELDKYSGKLYGLLVVEVEFNTEEQSKNFVAPEWFGEEITYNTSYKNRNLAINPEGIIIA